MSGSPAEAHALALFRAGRLAEARQAWSDILRASPEDPQALHMLGYILTRMGEADEGMRLIERSIERAPRAAPFLNNRAQVLAEAGRIDEAIGDLRRAVQLDAKFAAAYLHLGILLRRAGRLEEALAAIRRVLALDAGNCAARENLGLVLNQMGLAAKDRGDLDAAADAFARAIGEGVATEAHLLNAASVALDLAHFDEAHELYRRALAAKPGWADAEYGLAQVALRREDYAAGWAGYGRRFEAGQAVARAMALPRLRGDELAAGHRIAIWSEQGVGDQILFSTLLPELVERGARAVVEVDERLLGLYRRSLPSLEFTTRDASAQAFEACDRELPLGSLPSFFRNDAASFARQPGALLQPDAARVAQMREALGPGRWIAISWRSLQAGERRALAARKSIPLERFAALAAEGVRLLDLQYGDAAAERDAFERAHPGLLARIPGLDAYADLEGVAAAMAACEAVVTASNVTAHLAGAIGASTRLVYPGAHAPFFYWVPDAAGRSAWYPSVRIAANGRLDDSG